MPTRADGHRASMALLCVLRSAIDSFAGAVLAVESDRSRLWPGLLPFGTEISKPAEKSMPAIWLGTTLIAYSLRSEDATSRHC